MKRPWLHSASFQPMNGQPVWLVHTGVHYNGDLSEPYSEVIQAIYEWIDFGTYPFRWRTSEVSIGTFFLGHGLWQPRLDGEPPDPPPAEKPKV